MQTRRVGERALLVECDDAASVTTAYAALRARAGEIGALDIVPAARSVLIDGVADLVRVEALVRSLTPARQPARASGSGEVEIPVTYDGADLSEVARQWQVDPADVVRIHCAAEYVVAFCGFAPGFAYCTGLPDGLTVSRRAEPRSRVPVGSVALAAEFTSVYPSASPGGWQLIGRTDLPVWRPADERPALLEPGTRVRFRDASSLGSSTQGFREASSLDLGPGAVDG